MNSTHESIKKGIEDAISNNKCRKLFEEEIEGISSMVFAHLVLTGVVTNVEGFAKRHYGNQQQEEKDGNS
jgi:hypothetical protein